jgi:hypothetical protein
MTVKIILKPVKTAKTKFNKDIYQQKKYILIRTKINISSSSYLRLMGHSTIPTVFLWIPYLEMGNLL